MEAAGSYETFLPIYQIERHHIPEKLNISLLEKLGYQKCSNQILLGQKGGKIEEHAQSFKLTGKPYCPSHCTDVWCNVKDDYVLNASQTFHRKRELLSYSKQMTSCAEILPSLSSIGLTYTRNSSLRKLQLQCFHRYH